MALDDTLMVGVGVRVCVGVRVAVLVAFTVLVVVGDGVDVLLAVGVAVFEGVKPGLRVAVAVGARVGLPVALGMDAALQGAYVSPGTIFAGQQERGTSAPRIHANPCGTDRMGPRWPEGPIWKYVSEQSSELQNWPLLETQRGLVGSV